MIQFDTNGVTLFYIDADGNKVWHNFMDGAPYNDMLTIKCEQQQAATDNLQAASNYTTVIANLQISVDAGRTVAPAPPKPLRKVVSDTGDVTYTAFVPALPDLVITKPGTAVPAPAAPVDQQAVMYNMILAMFRKMFPSA